MMRKNGWIRSLAVLTALLLALPASWTAFAETITEPKYVNEGSEILDADIEVVGHAEALDVTSSEGSDTEVTVNGNVSLEAIENDSTALRVSSGAGSTTDVTVTGSVEATGIGEGGSEISGVWITSRGETTVFIYGDLVVTAEEMTAMGINTLDRQVLYILSRGGAGEEAIGSSGSVTVGGDMVVTSEDYTAIGINATQGGGNPQDVQVDIGGDLTVSGADADGIAAWCPDESAPPEKEFHIGGDLNVTGTQGDAHGVGLEGNQTTTVDITGDLNVSGAGEAWGVQTITGDNTVNIGGDVTAEGAYDTQGVVLGSMEEDDRTELTVGGSVNASSGEGNVVGVAAAGDGTVLVDIAGDVSAISVEGQEEALGLATIGNGEITVDIGGSVDASGAVATGVRTELVTGAFDEGTENPETAGTIAVNITGDVNAEGSEYAQGVSASVEEGTLTVDIGGALNASSSNGEGGGAVGLELTSASGGTITATVGEGITADGGSDGGVGVRAVVYDGGTVDVTVEAGGITSSGGESDYNNNAGVEVRNDGGTMNVDVTGDIDSTGMGIYVSGMNPDEETTAETTVHVDGNVTVTGEESFGIMTEARDHFAGNYVVTDGTFTGEADPDAELYAYGYIEDDEGSTEVPLYYDEETGTLYDDSGRIWEEERQENNSKAEILVEGDVTADGTAVLIDMESTLATVDLTADGTVSGGEHSIVLFGEADAEQVTVTVWEVQPNDADALVERAEWDDEGQQLNYTRDEEAEKQIQYIIRIDQPDYISTEGTTEHNGYQVAHEGDKVFVKLNIPDGYTLDSVWRDAGQSLEVIQDAQGRYYLAVPRGGGVELSVTLREIEILREEAPRMLTIVMDPNGGTIDGKEGSLVISAFEGKVFTLPEAPEKEGAAFLGWYATPYAKEDARWMEPAADSTELKQPGQKDRITKNVFYTAIWGETVAETEAAETAEGAVG